MISFLWKDKDVKRKFGLIQLFVLAVQYLVFLWLYAQSSWSQAYLEQVSQIDWQKGALIDV